MQLAFITGASSGIGQALALRYSRAGYRLALVARRAQEMEQWARQHKLDGERCRIYAADVALVDSIVAAGSDCLRQQGTPDVVIANAGISVGMDSTRLDDLSVLARTLAVNNVGLAATFQPFISAMLARGSGRLVAVASVAGIRGLPGHGAYCSSKAAVISYCESLRIELRRTGIKVVTLCPGYIDTPMTQGNTFAMPFLMPVDAFAERAFCAIEAGSSYRVIPWQMALVAKLLRLLPNPVLDRVLAQLPRKQRSK